LYDAATLHAPCQVYPFPYTLTGSFLNDFKFIVHDHGELQMHLQKQSEYGQAEIPECPGLLTPSRHKRCVQMAMRMQMRGDPLGKDNPNVDTSTFSLQPVVMPPRSALIRQCLSAGRSAQHVCTPTAPACVGAQNAANFNWPRGVTVSTLDSESSDRGSNPREAFCQYRGRPIIPEPLHDAAAALLTHRLRMVQARRKFGKNMCMKRRIARLVRSP
jgi:hypothetical protein